MDLGYAKVVVELPIFHLDREFDYSIPADLRAQALPGCRVRVRFAGQRRNGYITELVDSTQRPEKTAPILDVLGPSVVTPAQFRLARLVADRWIGTLTDVLRSAIPPRHVRTETAVTAELPLPAQAAPALDAERAEVWREYGGGVELLQQLHQSPNEVRAALLTLPGHGAHELAVDAALAARTGVVILVPDNRDLDLLEKELRGRGMNSGWTRLGADVGPAARYRNYLQVLRGEAHLVIGTRSAVFAPIDPLRLLIVMDDGDDSLAEQHAPGWHAREVSALCADERGCGWLAVSAARSCELQHWVQAGWLASVEPPRDKYRLLAPWVRATSDADLARDPVARSARLPATVFATLRDGLARGPVLISVPRRGYQLHLVCNQCRNRADCSECHGPLQRARADALPTCMRCGARQSAWSCKWCNHTELRSIVVGAARTAEEIGRAFPDTPIIRSGREQVVANVPDEPAIVISTPGAEPRVDGGYYAAAAILDAELVLARIDLRTEEETFRRWQAVCALVAPRTGKVAIAGDDGHPVIQALVRHDPIGFAERALAERQAAGMPPAQQLFEITATPGLWQSAELTLPPTVRLLGPVVRGPASEPVERVLLTCGRTVAKAVAAELRAQLAKRSAAKAAGSFVVRVDPVQID